MPTKVNPHALADWAIETGRLPLNGRAAFLVAFRTNPSAATADVLSKAAVRDAERPCPIFEGSGPREPDRGPQPALALINPPKLAPAGGWKRGGRIPLVSRALSRLLGFEVNEKTLVGYLNGTNQPPAEVLLGLAEVLDVEITDCWTAETIAANYVGPRGFAISNN